MGKSAFRPVGWLGLECGPFVPSKGAGRVAVANFHHEAANALTGINCK
jgi:hypothetical protein